MKKREWKVTERRETAAMREISLRITSSCDTAAFFSKSRFFKEVFFRFDMLCFMWAVSLMSYSEGQEGETKRGIS